MSSTILLAYHSVGRGGRPPTPPECHPLGPASRPSRLARLRRGLPRASTAGCAAQAGPRTGWWLAHLDAMDGHPEALIDLGAIKDNVSALARHARRAQVRAVVKGAGRAGHPRLAGIWSHLACADIPGPPSFDAQLAAVRAAVELAEQAGARPEVRHLANTPATLTLPQTWFDLVRPGGGVVGLSTLPGGAPGWLRPAMTVRAVLVQVKRVPAGTGVSYGHRYTTGRDATLGLVPLGYAEGIPRHASNTAEAQVRGRPWTISGTVSLNQVVVDFGDEPVAPGDDVVLFGPGDEGRPTRQGAADSLGTLSYDIVTRFAGRVPRSYLGVTQVTDPVLT